MSNNIVDELNLHPEAVVAQLRNVTRRTLANERSSGKGPPYVRLGRKIFYPKDGLKKFLAATTITPSRAPTLIDGKPRQGRR